MAYQLSDIRALVLQRLGWAATDTFATAAELNNYINDSLAELHSLLVSVYPAGEWGVGGETITTSPGVSTYTFTSSSVNPLPGRLVSLKFLFGDRQYPVERYNFINDIVTTTARGWAPGIPRYTVLQVGILGWGISVEPPPAGAYQLTAYYIAGPPVLVADADTSWMGFDEYVVLDVMAKCLIKEEADASGPLGQKEAFVARIKTQATPIDVGMPPTISDGRGVNSGDTIAASWFWR